MTDGDGLPAEVAAALHAVTEFHSGLAATLQSLLDECDDDGSSDPWSLARLETFCLTRSFAAADLTYAPEERALIEGLFGEALFPDSDGSEMAALLSDFVRAEADSWKNRPSGVLCVLADIGTALGTDRPVRTYEELAMRAAQAVCRMDGELAEYELQDMVQFATMLSATIAVVAAAVEHGEHLEADDVAALVDRHLGVEQGAAAEVDQPPESGRFTGPEVEWPTADWSPADSRRDQSGDFVVNIDMSDLFTIGMGQALAQRLNDEFGEDLARETLLGMLRDPEPDLAISPEVLRAALDQLDGIEEPSFTGYENEPDADGWTMRLGSYSTLTSPHRFVVERERGDELERLYEYAGEARLGSDDLGGVDWTAALATVRRLLPEFHAAERLIEPDADPGAALDKVGSYAGGAPGLLAEVASSWCSHVDDWDTVDAALACALGWMPLIEDPWDDRNAIRDLARAGIRAPDADLLDRSRRDRDEREHQEEDDDSRPLSTILTSVGEPTSDSAKAQAAHALGLPLESVRWALAGELHGPLAASGDLVSAWIQSGVLLLRPSDGEIIGGEIGWDSWSNYWVQVVGAELFRSDYHSVFCHDAATLAFKWHAPCSGQVRVEEGIALVRDGGNLANDPVTIRAVDVETGEELWVHHDSRVRLIGTCDGRSYLSRDNRGETVLEVNRHGSISEHPIRNCGAEGRIISGVMSVGEARVAVADLEARGAAAVAYGYDDAEPWQATPLGTLWRFPANQRLVLSGHDGSSRVFDLPPDTDFRYEEDRPDGPWVAAGDHLLAFDALGHHLVLLDTTRGEVIVRPVNAADDDALVAVGDQVVLGAQLLFGSAWIVGLDPRCL